MTGATLIATSVALLAFAANSLLCRLALEQGLADAAGFTGVRVVSGALTLALILWPRWRRRGRRPADPRMVAMLFAYMACFSFAYLALPAGTGALLLFGAVQLTMFGAALRAREPFNALAWTGLTLAAGGLAWLVAPGLGAPEPLGALLMAAAGVAWGLYSLLGRGAADPLEVTANNFLYCVPPALALVAVFAAQLHLQPAGLALALASGVLASGLGYVAWYTALRGLTAGRAATVQLSVPVLAAIGGVIWLGEPLTPRLLLASAATLGGIALVLAQGQRPASAR